MATEEPREENESVQRVLDLWAVPMGCRIAAGLTARWDSEIVRGACPLRGDWRHA